METEKILFITFISIFIVTAIITLASLPGWIKIPNNYLKILFSSLILEVIASIFVYSKQANQFECKIEKQGEWIAMNLVDGRIIQPKVIFKDSSKNILLGIAPSEIDPKMQEAVFSIEKDEHSFNIRNKDNLQIGKVKYSSLKHAKLFNTLKSGQGEIAESNDYKVIKYFFDEQSRTWSSKGKFDKDCPLSINVTSTPILGYSIKIDENEVFNSDNESKDVFNPDNRKLHFFKSNDHFYLIRITQADLEVKNGKFIYFMVVRLQPEIKI